MRNTLPFTAYVSSKENSLKKKDVLTYSMCCWQELVCYSDDQTPLLYTKFCAQNMRSTIPIIEIVYEITRVVCFNLHEGVNGRTI